MKRLLFGLLLIVFFGAEAKPKKALSDATELRFATYNIWSHLARESQIKKGNSPATRSWESSREAVAKLIVSLDCDVVAMQEVTELCRDDIERLVKKSGGKYTLWWQNSYPEGHKRIIGNAVLFRKGAFKISEQRMSWFSLTPTVYSVGWDEMKFYRTFLSAVVEHKKSGRKFFLMAVHGPLGKEASAHAAGILAEIEKMYNTENLPVVVMGDMNAHPATPFYKAMCEQFDDAYNVAQKRCSTIGSFNGSAGLDDNLTKPRRRIDHIYLRSTEQGKWSVVSYEVDRTKYDLGDGMRFPSDHNPVYVDLKLE